MNIYNFDEFRQSEYSWNSATKRRARNYFIKLGVGIAIILALIATFGYLYLTTDVFSFGTFCGQGAAMVLLSMGLRLALNAASRKQTRKMPLDEKHDYALYFYHRHGRKNAVLGNFYLVICAQADVCQRKYELAEQALDQIIMEKCKADQLKQIWLLRLIIALAIEDEEKIQETFICYNGIEVRSKGFPSIDIVRECLDNRDAETLTEVMKQSVVVKKEHPLRIGCISIFLAYCILFYAAALGIDTDSGYVLRYTFATVSILVTFLGLVILVIWLNIRLFGNETFSRRSSVNKACFVVVCVIFLLCMAGNSVLIYLGLDWKEEVMSQDEDYTYLKVYSDNGYNATTTLYRTNNPFVMQRINNWLPSADSNRSEDSSNSSNSDQDTTDSSSNTASNSTSDENTGETTEDQNADGSTTDSGSVDSDSDSSELEWYQQLENEMTAVFEYLQNEGKYTDSELSFDANAKGEIYGLVSAGQEQVGTRMVDVEYRLYVNFNGEKTNDEGKKCTEIVLEKVYPSGSYSTELVDFYLVDPDTLQVVDEHKTTW